MHGLNNLTGDLGLLQGVVTSQFNGHIIMGKSEQGIIEFMISNVHADDTNFSTKFIISH